MKQRRVTAKTNWQIFAIPLFLALLTLVGLIAGLLGDGLSDILSWAGLFFPLAAIVWAFKYRRIAGDEGGD
tara:strand:- start:34 stop:246 length:213 start_codon:yes stop_codon:yes gene_type:complete